MIDASSVLSGILEKLPSINKLGQDKLELMKENTALKSENNDLKKLVRSLRERLQIVEADLRLANIKIRELEQTHVPDRVPIITQPRRSRVIEEEKPVCVDSEPEIVITESFFDIDDSDSPPEEKVRPRKKRISLLPKKTTITEVMSMIESTETSNMHELVKTLLYQQCPSIYGMKRFFTDCLNTAYMQLTTIDRDDEKVEKLVTFIIVLSRRVSRTIYECFMQKISSDAELKSRAVICDIDFED